jgi:hypothetical protein
MANMRHPWTTAVLLAFPLFPIGISSPRGAEQIPSGLRGKSVVLSWMEARTFDPTGNGGQHHTDELAGSAKVYFSVQGRIFTSQSRNVSTSDGRADSGSSNLVSGDARNDVQWRFDRGALVGDAAITQGVKRISVEFGTHFAACSMKVVYAKPNGQNQIIVKGWTGRTYHLVNFSTSSPNCSVRNGNIFADPQ